MLGERLGPYLIEAELGSGGMGTVYRGRVVEPVAGIDLGTHVALKSVHPHLLEREDGLVRFRREAELGRRVTHENVVRALDFGTAEVAGRPSHYLVMEYVEGQTLRALLAELGRVPEELCRHVGREVAKGLAAIHAAGGVHRDLTPANVLITPDHRVKVMDLGLAALQDEVIRLSSTGAIVGSVLYAAPEQLRGVIDSRADLYALGLLLYELASGAHALPASDLVTALQRQTHDTPAPLREAVPDVSEIYAEIVATLLAKAADKRFPDADTVLEVLEEGETSDWWRRRAGDVRRRSPATVGLLHTPRATRSVGRAKELMQLRQLLADVRAGRGWTALAVGEAGIGKTRLVDDLLEELRSTADAHILLYGAYPPGGHTAAAGAFVRAIVDHFGVDALEDGLAAHLGATPTLLPALLAFLRGDAPPSGTKPLSQEALQTVFVHLLRSLAKDRPTVLVIEDLHFASAAGLGLFAAVAHAVRDARILLVGTARRGLSASWRADLECGERTARIDLGRLGAEDVAAALTDLVGTGPLLDELAPLVAHVSEGNPYLAFEVVRDLKESDLLVEVETGGWRATRSLNDVALPSTAHTLVRGRVADLDDDDRQLLDLAACAGVRFDPLLLAEARGRSPLDVLQRVARLERRHSLIRADGRMYVFDHHLVHQVLYEDLPLPLRESLHLALAEALERRARAVSSAAQGEGRETAEICLHYLRSHRPVGARAHVMDAFDHLERAHRVEMAIDLLERALGVEGLYVGHERAALLLRLSEPLGLLGRRERQRTVIDEGLALAEETDDVVLRTTAHSRLAKLLIYTGGYAEAGAVLEKALELVETSGDPLMKGRGHTNLGGIFLFTGRTSEAQRCFDRALALAEEAGDREGEATARGNLLLLPLNRGELDDAEAHGREALRLAREVKDREGEGRHLGNLGLIAYKRGWLEQAGTLFEQALEIACAIGDRRGEATMLGHIGLTRNQQGELGAALTAHERSRALARETGDRRGESIALVHLGPLLALLGDAESGRRCLEEARAIATEIGAKRFLPYVLSELGSIETQLGDVAAARRALEGALEYHQPSGEGEAEADVLIGLARLELLAGRTDAARSLLKEALEGAGPEGRAGLRAVAHAQWAVLDANRVPEARGLLEQCADELGVSESMQVHFLLWQATGEARHLEEARRRLEQLIAAAPEERRAAMREAVPLHRDILDG